MTVENDRGSATVVMTVVLALGASVAIQLGSFARSLVDMSQAQNVADATALAGIHGSRPEAERVARENDARLVLFEGTSNSPVSGTTVHVIVDVNGTRAGAWASDEA